MAKETQGLETEVKVDETFKQGIVEPQQPEVKPPTAEEQMATLQQEMGELKTKFEQADKGLRSAQATLTQKDRLLKEKDDIRGEFETLKNMVKILATQPSRDFNDADGLEETARRKQPDIDAKFKELEDKESSRKYQEKLNEQVAEYGNRVIALGLTENDEAYWEIFKLVTNATPADFKLADIRLKKLEKEKIPVDNKPTDEIVELKKELDKLKKQLSGGLDSETGLSSGSSASVEQIRKNYRENPSNPAAIKAYMEWDAGRKK